MPSQMNIFADWLKAILNTGFMNKFLVIHILQFDLKIQQNNLVPLQMAWF